MDTEQQTNGSLRELALFAGAGGGILGGKLLGWRTVCAVEKDPYARDVLVARQNDGCLDPFPIWDDVCTFDGRPWQGRVDVVSGGFPCQPFSTAARGRNPAKDFWPEMCRVVKEVQPCFVFAENVSKKAIGKSAKDLAFLGYASKGVRLSAKDLGADHRRDRFWLCAYPNVHRELRQPLNAKVELLPEFCTNVWETFPTEPRMADGVANRVDRLRLTGNGQVPSVAAVAWSFLINQSML